MRWKNRERVKTPGWPGRHGTEPYILLEKYENTAIDTKEGSTFN